MKNEGLQENEVPAAEEAEITSESLPREEIVESQEMPKDDSVGESVRTESVLKDLKALENDPPHRLEVTEGPEEKFDVPVKQADKPISLGSRAKKIFNKAVGWIGLAAVSAGAFETDAFAKDKRDGSERPKATMRQEAKVEQAKERVSPVIAKLEADAARIKNKKDAEWLVKAEYERFTDYFDDLMHKYDGGHALRGPGSQDFESLGQTAREMDGFLDKLNTQYELGNYKLYKQKLEKIMKRSDRRSSLAFDKQKEYQQHEERRSKSRH